MTENSYLCNLIHLNPDTWKEECARRGINVKEDADLAIFSYGIDCDFSDPLVQEARGIIINTGEEDVTCWPFRKFGNSYESYADNIDWATARVQEKVDGSIVKLWHDKASEDWVWSSNSCIYASDAKLQTGVSIQNLIEQTAEYDHIKSMFDVLNKDLTYIFELVGPMNQIVIRYPDTKLYHIGTRDNHTGRELNIDLGITRPAEYRIQSLDDCLKAAKQLNKGAYPDNEGFVVVDNSWHRIKVKAPEYLIYHHMVNNGVITKERAFEILRSDDFSLKDFRAAAPEHAVKALLYYKDSISKEAEAARQTIINARQMRDKGYSRKEIAEKFKTDKHAFFAFKGLDNDKDPKDIVRSYSKNLLKLIPDHREYIKPQFVMLVGLPASGKSTYAARLKEEGFEHISSDAIRVEMGYGAGQGSGLVFAEMEQKTRRALKEGKNVIYDATNLIRKNRIHILTAIQNIECRKDCILFTEPFETCLERNRQREGFARVPEEVMDHMLRSFQTPMIYEGFDDISLIQTEKGRDLKDYLVMADGFEQDNPHHNLMLLEHMITAEKYIQNNYQGKQKELLKFAARYHDIGKLVTKNFKDAKGTPSKEAHYYGHENAGAYMLLSSACDLNKEDRLTISALINWHMRPYLQMKDEKRLAERQMLGPQFCDMLDTLHTADMYAGKTRHKAHTRQTDWDDIER